MGVGSLQPSSSMARSTGCDLVSSLNGIQPSFRVTFHLAGGGKDEEARQPTGRRLRAWEPEAAARPRESALKYRANNESNQPHAVGSLGIERSHWPQPRISA